MLDLRHDFQDRADIINDVQSGIDTRCRRSICERNTTVLSAFRYMIFPLYSYSEVFDENGEAVGQFETRQDMKPFLKLSRKEKRAFRALLKADSHEEL